MEEELQGGAMGREDWDLSHEYDAHDHAGDDDREWFIEVLSHGVLLLAFVGLLTLAPWLLSLVALALGLVLGVVSLILKLVAGALSLVISAIALGVSLVLKLALFLVSLLAHPAVLLLIALVYLARTRR